MMKKFTLIRKLPLLFLLFLFIFLTSFVFPISYIPKLVPEAYWGYAFLDGSPAPKGTRITVVSYDTGEVFGEGVVVNNSGLFSLDIIFDIEETPKDEGADNGERVIWKINDIPSKVPAPGEDTAISGEVNNNFKIEAISTSESNESNLSVLILGIVIILIAILTVFLIYQKKKS